ncbi:MAG TPA: glycosyl transferase family A [Planctomycetaceae bacterium]|nr:glycosyl transferase family A [Planctomycetaceae bacterium]
MAEPTPTLKSDRMPSVSVVLPTYKRGAWLSKCLASLLRQTIMPSEIVVGRREGDEESAAVICKYSRLSEGLIQEAIAGSNDNLAKSLNAAIAVTTGELVAMTDDDAEFPEDWLARLMELFTDDRVGGVGGRDNQAVNPGAANVVGELQWFGRLIGNHHLAVGPVRDVDVLKGVNCCYRGDLLREIGIDHRLRGKGNVANWELGISFELARRGYRLVFDPSLQVTHHVGPRRDGDTNCRGGFNGPAHADAVFNETLLLREHLEGVHFAAFVLWSIAIGSSSIPGVLQLPRIVLKEGGATPALRRWWYSTCGRIEGFRGAF